MPSKPARILSAALVGAAATALSVKPASASLVANSPLFSAASSQTVQADRDVGPPGERAWPQARYSRPLVRNILRDAAVRHHVDPKLVLAVSFWESGWDQSLVSATGAVGIMQVEPYAAADAGPALLGRTVDISDPVDNADVGVAILREDLDSFGNTAQALAAYYQGPASLRDNGMLPDTEDYVSGILSLMTSIDG